MLSTKLKEAAGNGADATLYVDDVFSTYLYTGNGSTQTITNGIDLAGKGGMVWIKSRSAATDHKLTDTVRGATKALISDTTGAETTDSTGLTAFSSTGFSLGANSVYNTNAATYASWTFREAAKFFDVVTYTGAGSGAQTINHNLGVTPGMIVVKKTSAVGNWVVWHNGISGQDNLRLNTTDTVTSFGAPDPIDVSGSTTSFTVGSGPTASDNLSDSGATYVAYLFAHDTSSTGIIQCGSYTGNGSATGPVVTLGWEPQYLMIKNASGTGNWQVIDSMRGMPVGSADATLQANLANAQSSVEYLSPTATGFQITSTNTQVNTSGSTYIYMAIRRPNKPPTSGTQVFSPEVGTNTSGSNPGIEFSDVVLSNPRNGSFDFRIASKLQGVGFAGGSTKYLSTASTAAEQSVTATTIPSSATTYVFGCYDNFLVSVMPSTVAYNGNAYFFKRAPGFFDEVCYTGTGSTTTQAHNLTVVPELMIVKERSAVNNWWVYDVIDGNTKYSVLNSTAIPAASSTAWNNTTPTASVFSIGTGANVNASAQTFVAYLFATLAGISKVGSYTGNGTGQAIACGFSAGARFVLIKRTDSTGGWYTFDSARGLTSGSSPYLLLNSTAAEVTGNNGVYASTGGFTLGATAITTTNIASATYIFLAVA
jgi:hypothetical protein